MNEQDIEALLKAAGPLPQSDPQIMNEIKIATEQAWVDVVSKRKDRKRRNTVTGVFAMAAALIVAVGLHLTINSAPKQLGTDKIAQVIKNNGSIILNGQHFKTAQTIKSGDSISTNNQSQLTIKLKDKTTITFAENTEVTLANYNTLNLVKGRIYVSSADINTQVTIITPWGNIKDIGTQYEVNMTDNELKVSMRTGKVSMALNNELIYAETNNGHGDVVTVGFDNQVRKQTIAATDPHWSWTHDTIGDINIDGLSVYDLMTWVNQITGKKITYSNASVKQAAIHSHLSGGVISPKFAEKTLPLILKTSKLTANITEIEIIVTLDSN